MDPEGAYIIRSPVATGDTNLATIRRDPLLEGDNDGVRFLFDLAFPFSYPGGSFDDPINRAAAGTPANGATVYDMAEIEDGDVQRHTNDPTYAGGGFDLTNAAGNGSTIAAGVVRGPASALADIWNAFSGVSQRFMVMGYWKLPESADWNASGSLANLFSCTDANGGYTATADLLTLAMASGSTLLSARRQVAAATLEVGSSNITPATEDFGSVVQLAYWRNATGSYFSKKSAAGRTTNSIGSYAANTQDFSAKRPMWGHAPGFSASNNGWNGVRVYRGALINLARDTRSELDDILDPDWDRMIARGRFS